MRLKAMLIQASRPNLQAASDARMGETVQPSTPRFNRSLRVYGGPDRLTGEPVAVLLRETLDASGIVTLLHDPQRHANV